MTNGKKRREKKKQLWKEPPPTHFSLWESVGKVFPHQFLRYKFLERGMSAFSRPRKKPYLYIGRTTRRFLNDEGGLITALEIDCLEQKLGVTDNVLKQGQQDIGIFAVKDVICGPLQMFPLQCGRWECPKYNEIRSLFEKVKKDDREQLYNHFVCSMLKEINSE